ncbi:MAG TPA: hypothetical protein VL379_00100 [Pseudomonadales bacterium]|nr:hypothetical protein [Pseudomonadales bacterium]
MNTRFFLAALALGAVLVNAPAFGHGGSQSDSPPSSLPPSTFANLPAQTILQLADVVTATARFQDVSQAIAEQYVDIGVFLPHMGHHYMRQDLVDARFDLEHPELLVYTDDPCGGALQLVAVEYAIPLDQSNNMPGGFVGKFDEWDPNDDFGLWTLHAWVWKYNPDGVFAPFNPQVP